MKHLLKITAAGFLSAALMGASCVEVTEPFELTLNVEGVSSTYNVPMGLQSFGSPQSCVTVSAQQYADTDYGITNARVTNISLRTVGSFAASVSSGSVTINGTPALTFAGDWNSYNEPQSLLTSGLLTPQGAGIDKLVAAVRAREPITVCSSGSLSQTTPSGLQVIVTVNAQMDVAP